MTIGGGTGSFTVLRGLKGLGHDLSAVVAMSDDGGSTGRLRTELGILPPGDVRQALVALSGEEKLMLELFNYRFCEGGLKGHNFGNLLLASLEKLTGDFNEAVKAAQKILKVQGNVIPVTTTSSKLFVKLASGEVIEGENVIDDEPPAALKDAVVKEVYLQPAAQLNPEAQKALLEADLIVIGPGDFWGSIMANLLVDGMKETLEQSRAKKVFISNLMTRWGQKGFKTSTYLVWAEKYTPVDCVLVNNALLDPELVNLYEADNEYPVLDDLGDDPRVLRADLLSDEKIRQDEVDEVKRSLLRHDSIKISTVIQNFTKKL